MPERFFGGGRSAFFLKPCDAAQLEYTLCRLIREAEMPRRAAQGV